MASEYYENWKVICPPDESATVICDLGNNPIAVMATSAQNMLARAGLIAAAPGLYDAVLGALEVFAAMAEHADGPAKQAAEDMIPVMESALAAANLMGEVSPDVLSDV